MGRGLCSAVAGQQGVKTRKSRAAAEARPMQHCGVSESVLFLRTELASEDVFLFVLRTEN